MSPGSGAWGPPEAMDTWTSNKIIMRYRQANWNDATNPSCPRLFDCPDSRQPKAPLRGDKVLYCPSCCTEWEIEWRLNSWRLTGRSRIRGGRDPRIDPRTGDVVRTVWRYDRRVHWKKRTVISTGKPFGDSVVYLNHSGSRYGTTRYNWALCYRTAVVLHVAEGDKKEEKKMAEEKFPVEGLFEQLKELQEKAAKADALKGQLATVEAALAIRDKQIANQAQTIGELKKEAARLRPLETDHLARHLGRMFRIMAAALEQYEESQASSVPKKAPQAPPIGGKWYTGREYVQTAKALGIGRIEGVRGGRGERRRKVWLEPDELLKVRAVCSQRARNRRVKAQGASKTAPKGAL